MGEHSNDKKIPPFIRYIPHFSAFFLISTILAYFTTKLLATSFFGLSDGQLALVAGITQSCAAIFSVCLLAYQLKDNAELNRQQRNIDEAQFVLQYNRAFIENKDMAYVERRLEQFAYIGVKGKQKLINNKNRQYFINYLVYFEGLALSILRGEVSLERIDDLMGYRFFLIMNNPEILKKELQAFPDYYRGCIVLYERWKKHREDLDKKIPQEGYSLDVIWKEYSTIVNRFSRSEPEKYGINHRKK